MKTILIALLAVTTAIGQFKPKVDNSLDQVGSSGGGGSSPNQVLTILAAASTGAVTYTTAVTDKDSVLFGPCKDTSGLTYSFSIDAWSTTGATLSILPATAPVGGVKCGVDIGSGSLDINALTEQTTPTLADDTVAIYDVGLTALRKVKLVNLPFVATSTDGTLKSLTVNPTSDAAGITGRCYDNAQTNAVLMEQRTGNALLRYSYCDGSQDVFATSTPATDPAAGSFRWYFKTGTGLCWKDSAGAETCAGPSGGTWQAHIKFWGTGASSVLQDTDDELSAFRQALSARTITKVVCESDTGTPTIMLQKDDGSPADMFAAAMTCRNTPSGTDGTLGILTSFQSGENALAQDVRLDALIVVAGGSAHWVAITISGTID
jgi:hypothetical protein